MILLEDVEAKQHVAHSELVDRRDQLFDRRRPRGDADAEAVESHRMAVKPCGVVYFSPLRAVVAKGAAGSATTSMPLRVLISCSSSHAAQFSVERGQARGSPHVQPTAVVPLAAPGVFTTAIIAFFIAWNDFVYGISLTSTDAARPVPAALSFFTGASQFEEPTGAISAAAIVVTIPIVIVVVIFQRRIVSGLTQGAVKG